MIVLDAYFWWAIRTLLSVIVASYFIKAYRKIPYIGLTAFIGASLGEVLLRTLLLFGIVGLGSFEWNILLTIIGLFLMIGSYSVFKIFNDFLDGN